MIMKPEPVAKHPAPQKALFSLSPKVFFRKLSSPFSEPSKLTASEAKRLQKQIKDFAGGGIALVPQRQGIYIGALLLCSFFFSFWLAFYCFLFCQFSEVLDTIVSRRVMRWNDASPRKARRYYYQLLATSTLSSVSVAVFVILVASLEGTSEHLTSLFFIFAAGLFAAVNNHQLPIVLAVRLIIYGAVFLYIPIKDIFDVRPPLQSELYLHLATVVFVLFFVLECSMIFLRLYQRGLDQLEELRIERDRAKEVSELKSQFVSVVSHELRTPLTSIIGALGLIKNMDMTQNPDGFQKILGIANKNSKRLSNLINDLLDLQKLESDQMHYNFAPLDPVEMARDSVEAISAHADGVGVKVTMAKPSTKDMCVLGDCDRLTQVLDNLLSNAVKFSDKNSKVLVTVETNEDQAVISVQDQGIGIPFGSEEIVFGKFSQVDGSDHRAHEGTGLGLNIVQQIVQAHGGRVDYDSAPGVGTVFYVRIPLSDPEVS